MDQKLKHQQHIKTANIKDIHSAFPEEDPNQQKEQQTDQQQEQEQKTKTGFTDKPSAQLKVKTMHPFDHHTDDHEKNSFAHVFDTGGIPCKLDHTTNKIKLAWKDGIDLSNMDYDPLLIICFQGLQEDTHPNDFIAAQCIKEMLQAPNAAQKSIKLLPNINHPLRIALMSKNDRIFYKAIEAFKLLSICTQMELNKYLPKLLVPIVKRLGKHEPDGVILELLRVVEKQGQKQAFKIIKLAIPTHCCI